MAESRDGFVSAVRWLAGPSRGARAVRIATAALLFVWAGLDQLHFYWASRADNVASLQRAAELNPNDSAAQMRLARAQQLAGQRDASLQAMQRAAALNQANLGLQESLARGLIEAGRDADAYTQYQKILARWPRNANALINYGLLAHRLGHDEEAVDSWQRAVDVDPTQANGQLYLAQGLEQRGEELAAARHYRAYLASVAAHPAEHRGEGGTVLAVLLKVADADAAANQMAAATTGYTAAITYAEKSGEKALESLALTDLADLQEKEGKVAAAAQSYQRALALDAALSDQRNAAVDWLNYGQFLRRQHQPERLVFACLLTAENLLRGIPGEQLSVVSQARAESAARLGREGASVRRNVQAIANEAAALSPTAFAVVTPTQK